jgi:hypothetical protein
MLGKVSQCLQCTQHVPTQIQVPSPPVRAPRCGVSNYGQPIARLVNHSVDDIGRTEGGTLIFKLKDSYGDGRPRVRLYPSHVASLRVRMRVTDVVEGKATV